MIGNTIRRVLKERSAATLIIAGALAVTLGLLRESDLSGTTPKAFWATKAHWGAEADMVLAGDSRVLCSLSPSAMEEVLQGSRILNYGFGFLGFSRDYLASVEDLLATDAVRPTVVLGVSPLSLTEGTLLDNGYLSHVVNGTSTPKDIRLGRVMLFFSPITTREIFNWFKIEGNIYHRYRHYHSDGWMESYEVPEHPEAMLALYSPLFLEDRLGAVSQRVVDQLLETVSQWRKRGVEVYGFRSPTAPEMAEMEKIKSRWDPEAFGERFEEAAGVWFSFDPSEYHTYDASHLDPSSTVRFSRELARKIHEIRAEGRNVPSKP